MKILVLAYEFFPRQSPQALRWMYLSRGLVAEGQEVHVLTSECPFASRSPPAVSGDGPFVHRTPPGWISGSIDWLARRKGGSVRGGMVPAQAPERTARLVGSGRNEQPTLNWKGRLVARVHAAASSWYFPDSRGEWERPARSELKRLLRQLQPDVVISSHEPATTLVLGLLVRQRGFQWVADLGDPVEAPYTPPRWRERSRALEKRVCDNADAIVVTSEATRDLLMQRHALPVERIHVITQGFSTCPVLGRSPVDFDDERLELLFTGAFYDFRDPSPLLQAVARDDGVRLTIATARFPEHLQSLVEACAERVRLVGFVSHEDALAMQRSAHVLVDIGNRDSVQVPGKVYEYLGARRLILHVSGSKEDAVSGFLADLDCGVSCEAHPDAILSAFATLRRMRQSEYGKGPATSALMNKSSWSALALRYRQILERLRQRARP